MFPASQISVSALLASADHGEALRCRARAARETPIQNTRHSIKGFGLSLGIARFGAPPRRPVGHCGALLSSLTRGQARLCKGSNVASQKINSSFEFPGRCKAIPCAAARRAALPSLAEFRKVRRCDPRFQRTIQKILLLGLATHGEPARSRAKLGGAMFGNVSLCAPRVFATRGFVMRGEALRSSAMRFEVKTSKAGRRNVSHGKAWRSPALLCNPRERAERKVLKFSLRSWAALRRAWRRHAMLSMATFGCVRFGRVKRRIVGLGRVIQGERRSIALRSGAGFCFVRRSKFGPGAAKSSKPRELK